MHRHSLSIFGDRKQGPAVKITVNMAAQNLSKQGFTKSGKPAFHRDIVPVPGKKITKSVNLLNRRSLNRVPDCIYQSRKTAWNQIFIDEKSYEE